MGSAARRALIVESDPYTVLGLTPAATAAEIEKARRRVAAAHHPDTGPASERTEREAAMKRINVAYELLRDPAARAAYDLARRPVVTPRTPSGATTVGTTTTPAAAPTFRRRTTRRPRRRQRTSASGLTLLSALSALLRPIVASHAGGYLLLIAGGLLAARFAPDRIIDVVGWIFLLYPLVLRRLRATPAGDLLSLFADVIDRRGGR